MLYCTVLSVLYCLLYWDFFKRSFVFVSLPQNWRLSLRNFRSNFRELIDSKLHRTNFFLYKYVENVQFWTCNLAISFMFLFYMEAAIFSHVFII